MDFPVSPNDSRVFLLAIALGAIVGVMFGGWVMTALHKMLMVLAKMALLGAVVVIGIVLWNGYQASRQPQYAPGTASYQVLPKIPPTQHSSYEAGTVSPSPDRWWEQ